MKAKKETGGVSTPSTHGRFKDLTGRIFGRLTVVGFAEWRPSAGVKGRRSFWMCQCKCGNTKAIVGASLTLGLSTSCGCFHKEEVVKRFTTHGGKINRKASPTYSTWCNMLTRTTNKNGDRYEDYGGRGVGVCESWKSFEVFLKDMGPRPKGTSLDRIDNNLGYSVENCRWASHVEQGRNKRSNRIVNYQGREICMSELAEITGMSYIALYHRILTKKMSVDEALAFPVRRRKAR